MFPPMPTTMITAPTASVRGENRLTLFSTIEGNTLHANHAKEVDGQPTAHSRGHRAHQGLQLADKAQQDGDNAGRHQNRAGVVAGDSHQRIVLAVVGAGRSCRTDR